MWGFLGTFFSEAGDVSRRLNLQFIKFHSLLGETVIDLICDFSFLWILIRNSYKNFFLILSFPVAQMVEHGASNANIMGSIPRESKSWSNVKL